MKVQGIDEFAEELKNRFETEAVTAVKNALCLQYPFSDMLRIICIYIKHTRDSLVNEEAFVADGAELGIMTVVEELQAILAVLEMHNYTEN